MGGLVFWVTVTDGNTAVSNSTVQRHTMLKAAIWSHKLYHMGGQLDSTIEQACEGQGLCEICHGCVANSQN